MTASPADNTSWPLVRPLGFDGLLVSFADRLDDGANRAALALRSAMEAQGWEGVTETATTLVSAYLRFDPLIVPHDEMRARLAGLVASRDWRASPMPEGRKRVTIPTVYGGEFGPQLEEAATLAGIPTDEAVQQLSSTWVKVQAIGFAPGQPYLGPLPERWNIPRQETLTPTVPAGALVVAIRQFVLFAVSAPTGWRHVGRTAFPLFRPDRDAPFALNPGDEVCFAAVPPARFEDLEDDPEGGATIEALP